MKKKLSEEHKRKIGLANSIANKGNKPWMTGRHHTKESRKKISEARKKLRIELDLKLIRKLYITEMKTAQVISKLMDCSETTIHKRLKQMNICRNKSQSKKGNLNPRFGKKPHNFGKKYCDYEPIRRSLRKAIITKKRLVLEGKLVSHKINLTYEEIYGFERAKQLKKKMSNTHKQRMKLYPEELLRFKEIRKYLVMPKEDTKIEKKIQVFLSDLDISFKTHIYIQKIEHAYQCDILIPEKNLIIECDGDYWHGNPIKFDLLNKMQKDKQILDGIRTNELIKEGYSVLRLWECDINSMDVINFKSILKRFKSDVTGVKC